MADDLLGGGLDIDGWNFIKLETTRNVQDLADRSHVHRQMVPILRKTMMLKPQFREAKEVVIAALDASHAIEPLWIAERIKRGLDNLFGASWHVVVGEEFTFDIDYDDNLVFHMFYGNVGILAWKCGAILPSSINHISDPNTKEKMKSLLLKKRDDNDTEVAPQRKKARDYFSEKI
ncbi:hypothetical protein TCAL_12020 [Tigriopus californicus]|uniref:Dynein light chain n=1 Tax=Tigriopus californicus TaxID=6832 RepID=A0A553NSG9_TIGCA|nr:dynein axonemal light chain 4-like [Tigriopus californicus]TRY68382.1 hypothetical protein TCAL_12020 [Tigriopus californicus]